MKSLERKIRPGSSPSLRALTKYNDLIKKGVDKRILDDLFEVRCQIYRAQDRVINLLRSSIIGQIS